MKVPVERYIEQVKDGSHYKGYIKIADTKLDYELKFAVPIPRLDDMESPKNLEEVRRVLQLALKRNEVNIDLTDEEFGFFMHLLLQFAVEFYNNPQTRGNNEGLIGMALRGEGLLADFGACASIGITSSGSYDFQPELCEMLNAVKFDCALAV